MNASTPVYISLEFTPNPNTLKYSVNRELYKGGAVEFASQVAAKGNSPLAEKIFAIQGVSNVMVGRDFVTITKSESGDWDQVHKSASHTIETHLTDGGLVLSESYLAGLASGPKSGAGDSEIEKKIREVLDAEIRPAVAMDGGDITFDRYENGTVYVQLKGSCSGCPSSTMTLKMGIENRLQQLMPEIKEVVAV